MMRHQNKCIPTLLQEDRNKAPKVLQYALLSSGGMQYVWRAISCFFYGNRKGHKSNVMAQIVDDNKFTLCKVS